MDINAELDTFDRLVREQLHEPAFQKLLVLLKSTSIHRQKPDQIFDKLSREDAGYVATRMVSAAFQFFLDDGFRLSEQGFAALSLFGRNFTLVVQLTPYRSSDHVIRQLIGQDAGGGKKESVDIYTFRKVLFLWSIYSSVVLPIKDYLKTYPELMKYVVFNALTFNCYLDPEVTERREQLLDTISEYGFDFSLDDSSVIFAGPSWMYCAYPHTPRKHDIKKEINRAYRRYLFENGAKEPLMPTRRAVEEKPRLLVVVEQMTSSHAVFRCYGKALESLRKRFYTIGAANKVSVDDKAMSIFDRALYFDGDSFESIRKNIGKIVKEKPDIIIYLSLGMQNNTIPMAALRLAPIQILFTAHPCTSKMDSIDYVVAYKGAAPSRAEFSERLVLVPDAAFEYVPIGALTHDVRQGVQSGPLCDNSVIKVAIPSFSIKLTGRFVNVLRKISEISRKKIEYHFFPYLRGISFVCLSEEMCRLLPGAVVHPPYAYEKYLSCIGDCHFHMSPFPFGNTNGNIDSAKMGLPIIAMNGDGIESKIDVSMLKRMGLPDWVVAQNEDEYVRLAVSLAEDDGKREELSSLVRKINMNEVFYDTGMPDIVVKTIRAIYVMHEKLMESSSRVFDALELIAADDG